MHAHRADEVGDVVVVGGGVGLSRVGRPVQAVVLADEDGVHIVGQICMRTNILSTSVQP